MFGLAAEKLAGRKLETLLDPDQGADTLALLESGEPVALRRRDGSTFRGLPFLSANRAGWTLQVADVDAIAARHDSLARRESTWRHAIEAAGHGVWEVDTRKGTRFYSDGWKRMRGLPLDSEPQQLHESWQARVHPDDIERVRSFNDHYRVGAGDVVSFEYRERRLDGQWIWISSRGRAVKWDDDGTAVRVLGTDTDITHLKEARQAVETLSQRLELALKTSGVGIWEVDLDKRHLHLRRALADDLRFSGKGRRGSFPFSTWQQSLHPDDAAGAIAAAHKAIAVRVAARTPRSASSVPTARSVMSVRRLRLHPRRRRHTEISGRRPRCHGGARARGTAARPESAVRRRHQEHGARPHHVRRRQPADRLQRSLHGVLRLAAGRGRAGRACPTTCSITCAATASCRTSQIERRAKVVRAGQSARRIDRPYLAHVERPYRRLHDHPARRRRLGFGTPRRHRAAPGGTAARRKRGTLPRLHRDSLRLVLGNRRRPPALLRQPDVSGPYRHRSGAARRPDALRHRGSRRGQPHPEGAVPDRRTVPTPIPSGGCCCTCRRPTARCSTSASAARRNSMPTAVFSAFAAPARMSPPRKTTSSIWPMRRSA